MFNASALLRFFDDHKDLPHVSKYHLENFKEHCLLVIDEMAKRTTDSAMLIAACLHDIAKPRTQGYNKINQPCFYGHEKVTDEELSQFLTPDDARYERVKALILCHMTPYNVINKDETDTVVPKLCQKALKKAGIEIEVDDAFIHEVMMLHEADDAGTIRSDENLAGINERIETAISRIAELA
ncbi:MAG: HD domain-containing protein [Clostridia bacterium]|nr:HD domain-containing protein [Clostridia bacterium]